jgi:Family of unknown function (DUF6247)
VTAQPTEDPADPLVILRDLPKPEREEFLRQYHQAVDAAHDPAGYQSLRRLLHVWSLTVIAAGQPGYYEELAAAPRRNSHDSAGYRRDPGLGRTSQRSQKLAMILPCGTPARLLIRQARS